MTEPDSGTRWLVLAFVFGPVGGSLAGIVALFLALGSTFGTLDADDYLRVVMLGGVRGAVLNTILTAWACGLRRNRPFPAAATLLVPLVSSALLLAHFLLGTR